jgi:arylsulfatase A-like enzyme
MSFNNAHTPSTVCTPTRYGLLTGRYCWRTELKHGVLRGESGPLIEPERLTIAELLRDHGYATKMVGKWHLGLNLDWGSWQDEITGGPLDHGFDECYLYAASSSMPPYAYIRDRQFVNAPTEHFEGDRSLGMNDGPMAPGFDVYQLQPNLTADAVSYIKSREDQQEPFFLYFALTAPHFPIVPTPEFQGSSAIDLVYADFVRQVDADVGRVMDALEQAGLAENTLLIFTADNGCARQADFSALMSKGHNSSAGYRGAKMTVYEGGHRVPFIARWPRRVEPGSTSDALVCLTDLMRGTASILGAQLPESEGVDSYDMLPHLLGRTPVNPVRQSVVTHSLKGGFAIQEGDWKLIFGSTGDLNKDRNYPNKDAYPKHVYETFQLYNLESDPREFQNVYAEHPDIVQNLTALMTRIVDNGRETPGAPQQNHNGENRWEQVNWVE